MQLIDVVKIFVPTAFAFFSGLLITPIATHFFFKYQMWKKHGRNGNRVGEEFKKIHNEQEELRTPRVGGVIIWTAVLLTTLIFYLLSIFSPSTSTEKMNFLSRNQTLIPFFTLLFGSILGLWDDLVQIYGSGKFAHDDASWRRWKAFLVGFIS